MSIVPLVSLGLKAFTAFWSLITWVVAAAFVGQLNSYVGFNVTGGNLAGANVLIADGLFANIYFGVILFLYLKRPDNVGLSLMVDTIALGVLFILALGGTASLSADATFLADCGLSACKTGSGLIGVGWIFTFLLLGLLLLQVIWTLIHRDGAYVTWRTPFHQLAEGQASTGAGIGMSQKRSAENATTPATVQETA